MLLDLDMLSASIEITYSVQVVLRVRFADSRNFPFSTSKAAKAWHLSRESQVNCRVKLKGKQPCRTSKQQNKNNVKLYCILITQLRSVGWKRELNRKHENHLIK